MRLSDFPALAALVCGAALLSACDKGTDLNVDLPSATGSTTNYADRPLDVATVRLDSLETLKADHYLAGRRPDNVAGTTTATGILSLQPSTLLDSLPAKYVRPVLDSVVFVQNFDAVYGQATVPAVFDVFALAAPLAETGRYDAGTPPVLAPNPVALGLSGRLDRRVRLRQSKSDSTNNIVRFADDFSLRLTLYNRRTGAVAGQPFSDRLFAALRATPTFGQADLNAVLGGLVVAPAASYNQGIVSFVPGGDAGIQVFFHDEAPGARPQKWRSYRLRPRLSQTLGQGGPNDPRYYTFLESALGASPLAALADTRRQAPAPALGDVAYVRDGPALALRLRIPAAIADELAGKTINRAELYVPVRPFSNALYPFVEGLFAAEVDADNRILQRQSGLQTTPRFVQRDGANPLGANNEAIGPLFDASTSAPYYLMPITGYLQAYLANRTTRTETVPDGLVLQATGLVRTREGSLLRNPFNLTLNRSVIDVNTNGSGRSPRLRVYFSQLR